MPKKIIPSLNTKTTKGTPVQLQAGPKDLSKLPKPLADYWRKKRAEGKK